MIALLIIMEFDIFCDVVSWADSERKERRLRCQIERRLICVTGLILPMIVRMLLCWRMVTAVSTRGRKYLRMLSVRTEMPSAIVQHRLLID